jgi:hypothetical protein
VEDPAAIFDWRFAQLRRAGIPPQACWLLASELGIDVRHAERLHAAGCPPQLLVEILL